MVLLKSKKFKKQKDVRVYTFTLPLFPIDYQIFIGSDIDKASEAAEAEYPGADLGLNPNTGGYAARLSHPTEGYSFIILLTTDADPSVVLSVCAHEALHLCWFLCHTVGVRPKWNNHETQAYMVQEIFQNSKLAMEDFIKKNKLDIKL